MNITTKFETGSIVYAVHPCRAVCGGQIILNEEPYRMENNQTDNLPQGEDIFIVSPHRVKNVTASCGKNNNIQIWYELSCGVIRLEKDLFSSFENAAEYAAGLYQKSAGKDHRPLRHERADMLKEIVFGRIRHELEHILTNAQMESLEVEFKNATQGLVFQEA